MIYVGTFSKTLYPGLRLGYAVLPPALVTPLRQANVRQFREGDYVIQAALAEFMDSGGFAKHVARMRRLYRERQAALRGYLRLGDTLSGGAAGMHLVARLPSRAVERQLVASACARGIELRPLSAYFAGRSSEAGLVLGYANCDERTMARAGRWLDRALVGAAVTAG